MKIATAVMALMLAAPAVGVAQEQASPTEATTPSIDSRVQSLLSGIESAPGSDAWTALGPDAVPVLVRTLEDPESTTVTRGRAAIALGYFEDATSAAALRKVLAEKSPSLLLRKSMVALTRIEGPAALDAIKPHLGHKSKRVREQAILSIGKMGSAASKEVLTARRTLESSSYLRGKLNEAIARPAPGAPKVEPQPMNTASATGGAQ